MAMEGVEKAAWAAGRRWRVGRREGLGQPRRRLIGVFLELVAIDPSPCVAILGLIEGLNGLNEYALQKVFILYECSRNENELLRL